MKYTVPIIQMIPLVQTSYMMSVIKNHFLLRAVQFVMDHLIILVALKIVNPERYCLVTNDPAFCKTIGDLYDEDGFVKPEDVYCTK
jgi:hypothetical protein